MVFERSGNCREVSNLSQGCFKGVPRKNLEYFKEISRVFQESHKGDSRKIEGCFNGCFKGDSKVFTRSSMGA